LPNNPRRSRRFIIPTLDLGLSDGIHNNSSANLVLGSRWARVALGGVYGHSVKFLPPDLASVKCTSPTELELFFENVDERLEFGVPIPAGWPFAVRDSEGGVELKACHPKTKTSMRIELSRPLKGKAILTGAPTANPPAYLPFDTGGFWPMLAFTTTIAESASSPSS
jgi:sialate O-acetylesterase